MLQITPEDAEDVRKEADTRAKARTEDDSAE